MLRRLPTASFGVADDDVIVCDKEHICDLTLGAEGLTGARRTENQAVGVFEELSIHHDKVVGQSVDAAVQSFLTVLEKLLCGKRNEDGNTGSSQAAFDLDLVETQRQ